MFLKNWDMLKLYRIQYTSTNRDILEDQEVRVIDNIGNQDTINDRSVDFLDEFDNSAYYTSGYGSVGGFFIWPGGDINSLPANPQPVIEREKIRYEDFNLYSPFQGGTTPSSGMIYGQPHILSPAVYNKEKDQWERTVTREFKNESGSTITIRELGFYHRYVHYAKLLAREILDTPIEVANDSYFKISFTYKIENPHEHREEKRIRQYSLPMFYSFHSKTSGDPFECSPSLNEQKKRFLLVRHYDIYDTNIITDELLEQYYEKIPLTLEGWSLEKHIGHYSLYDKKVNNNREQTIITLDILTPDETENNKISSPGYRKIANNSGYYVIYNIMFLEDSIKNLSWDKETGLIQFDTSSFVEVNKLSNEQVIWVCSENPQVQQNSLTRQTDYYFCDNLDYYGNYGSDFIIDNTTAISHIFKLSHSSDYEGGAIAKLTIEMKDDTPLYEDVPVQR